MGLNREHILTGLQAIEGDRPAADPILSLRDCEGLVALSLTGLHVDPVDLLAIEVDDGAFLTVDVEDQAREI